MKTNEEFTLKEAIIYSQRVAQLSKALWKSVEKDWQNWIKPFDLNINEHHILWIAYHLRGATISQIAEFGVMHVSTAFNFSKKLEDRGFLTFSKKEEDKRNTYIELTEKGNTLLLDLMESYDPTSYSVFGGSLPIKRIFGKFPEFQELMSIIRDIYGSDFLEIFEKSIENIENDFIEIDGKLYKRVE